MSDIEKISDSILSVLQKNDAIIDFLETKIANPETSTPDFAKLNENIPTDITPSVIEKKVDEIVDDTKFSKKTKQEIKKDLVEELQNDNLLITQQNNSNSKTVSVSASKSSSSSSSASASKKTKKKAKATKKKKLSPSKSKSKTQKKGGILRTIIGFVLTPVKFVQLIVQFNILIGVINMMKDANPKTFMNPIQNIYVKTIDKIKANKLFLENDSKIENTNVAKKVDTFDNDILMIIKKDLLILFCVEFIFMFKIFFEYHAFLYFANYFPEIPYFHSNFFYFLPYNISFFIFYKMLDFFNSKKETTIEKENKKIIAEIEKLQREILFNENVLKKLNIGDPNGVIDLKKKQIIVQKNLIQKNKQFQEILEKNNITNRFQKLQHIYSLIYYLHQYLKKKDDVNSQKIKVLEKIYYLYRL
jgi:hypothetical protein